MSSKNFFVEGRNERSALGRPSTARFEAAYGEKRFFLACPQPTAGHEGVRQEQDFPLGARRDALRLLRPMG
jgi:hypothetical protein